jgi:bacterioferritin
VRTVLAAPRADGCLRHALSAELERAAIERLNDAVELAVSLHDHGSRELFAKILIGEEEHLDWVETQLHLIAELGEKAYLAEQLRPT